MIAARGRFLRDNAFLVAAVALPLLVVGFFLLSTALPRWLVPPPAYDLVLRSTRPFDGTQPRVATEIVVRDGRIEAIVRPLPQDSYLQPPALFLFDHQTMTVREIPLNIPAMAPGEPARTIAVDATNGRRVVSQDKAPDGYAVMMRTSNGPGV